MTDKNNNQPDVNSMGQPTAVFAQYYNENIPEAFPRVTVKILEIFQLAHPALFKAGGDWTIDRHRKKLMDWLASYREDI